MRLREAGYIPGMDFPEDENVRDGEYQTVSATRNLLPSLPVYRVFPKSSLIY